MTAVDTIVSISTPFGKSAIGMLRVSGPNTTLIINQIIKKNLTPRFATHCSVKDDNNKKIDDVIAIFYKNPSSFTGEDMLEIHTHGNPVILNYILSIICRKLARQSGPGEFTERAYLNNKIDLTQAEAVADLINASSIKATKAAMMSLHGNFSQQIKNILNAVLEIRAAVEASINFPEDDIPEKSFLIYKTTFDKIIDELRNLIQNATNGIKLNEQDTIVIIGKPNVGKSSIANALLGEHRSIVSSISGTTRDAIHSDVMINQTVMKIIDTAGIADTSDPLELEGIKISLKSIQESTFVLYVVDDATALTQGDKDILQKNNISDYWIIRNKIDKTGKQETVVQEDGIKTFYLSAQNKRGIDLLKNHLSKQAMPDGDNVGTARARHLNLLNSALQHLYMCNDYNNNQQLELVSEELKLAHQSLTSLIGGNIDEDLLDKIFSDFCIGK